MHKYQPRVRLVLKRDSKTFITDVEQHHKTFVFPETVFIGVTAYQNQLVRMSYTCSVCLYTQAKYNVYMYQIKSYLFCLR